MDIENTNPFCLPAFAATSKTNATSLDDNELSSSSSSTASSISISNNNSNDSNIISSNQRGSNPIKAKDKTASSTAINSDKAGDDENADSDEDIFKQLASSPGSLLSDDLIQNSIIHSISPTNYLSTSHHDSLLALDLIDVDDDDDDDDDEDEDERLGVSPISDFGMAHNYDDLRSDCEFDELATVWTSSQYFGGRRRRKQLKITNVFQVVDSADIKSSPTLAQLNLNQNQSDDNDGLWGELDVCLTRPSSMIAGATTTTTTNATSISQSYQHNNHGLFTSTTIAAAALAQQPQSQAPTTATQTTNVVQQPANQLHQRQDTVSVHNCSCCHHLQHPQQHHQEHHLHHSSQPLAQNQVADCSATMKPCIVSQNASQIKQQQQQQQQQQSQQQHQATTCCAYMAWQKPMVVPRNQQSLHQANAFGVSSQQQILPSSNIEQPTCNHNHQRYQSLQFHHHHATCNQLNQRQILHSHHTTCIQQQQRQALQSQLVACNQHKQQTISHQHQETFSKLASSNQSQANNAHQRSASPALVTSSSAFNASACNIQNQSPHQQPTTDNNKLKENLDYLTSLICNGRSVPAQTGLNQSQLNSSLLAKSYSTLAHSLSTGPKLLEQQLPAYNNQLRQPTASNFQPIESSVSAADSTENQVSSFTENPRQSPVTTHACGSMYSHDNHKVLSSLLVGQPEPVVISARQPTNLSVAGAAASTGPTARSMAAAGVAKFAQPASPSASSTASTTNTDGQSAAPKRASAAPSNSPYGIFGQKHGPQQGMASTPNTLVGTDCSISSHDEGFSSHVENDDASARDTSDLEDDDNDNDDADSDDESFYGNYTNEDLIGATISGDSENKWTLNMGRTRRNGQKRFFWQYNVQSKGPKGIRLCPSDDLDDPFVLSEASDPVFSNDCQVEGVKHSGKARRGDGNDLTPNPRKLLMIGLELKKLGKTINELAPVTELPLNIRSKTRKEKNKLASRACRLKKKAQHEANKIKLYGLQCEHKEMVRGIYQVRRILRQALGIETHVSSSPQNLAASEQARQISAQCQMRVAGSTSDYVNSVLEKVVSGCIDGGLTRA